MGRRGLSQNAGILVVLVGPDQRAFYEEILQLREQHALHGGSSVNFCNHTVLPHHNSAVSWSPCGVSLGRDMSPRRRAIRTVNNAPSPFAYVVSPFSSSTEDQDLAEEANLWVGEMTKLPFYKE